MDHSYSRRLATILLITILSIFIPLLSSHISTSLLMSNSPRNLLQRLMQSYCYRDKRDQPDSLTRLLFLDFNSRCHARLSFSLIKIWEKMEEVKYVHFLVLVSFEFSPSDLGLAVYTEKTVTYVSDQNLSS